MIEIRPATVADIPELRRVAIETQVDTFGAQNSPEVMKAFLRDAYDTARFEEEFQEKEAIYYLALEGPTLAGFIRLRTTAEVAHLLGKENVELQRLYVVKAFQGKKIGATLMQTALNYARAQKAIWLWLGVWEKNIPAQQFYLKWGFERFSEHIFWMGPDPQTDWLMRLKL